VVGMRVGHCQEWRKLLRGRGGQGRTVGAHGAVHVTRVARLCAGGRRRDGEWLVAPFAGQIELEQWRGAGAQSEGRGEARVH
jgi:hypothetical protein